MNIKTHPGPNPMPFAPPEWTREGHCLDDWELFDAPPDTPQARRARILCKRCPVKLQCAEMAQELPVEEVWGTWAGVSYQPIQMDIDRPCAAELHDLDEHGYIKRRANQPDRIVCRECEREHNRAYRARMRARLRAERDEAA